MNFKKLKDRLKKSQRQSVKSIHDIMPEDTGFSCPVCKNANVSYSALPYFHFREMDKNGFLYSIFLFETLNLEFYNCSKCWANDRSRLYALYINFILKDLKEGQSLKLLDIAPSPPLTKYLNGKIELDVRTADLEMEQVDDKVDITNMNIYPDNNFDAFICSHVLEHIDEDVQAMKELYRVLKPGGWGIAMVPIHLGLDRDHEDSSLKSESERWKYFGQNDHVRLYSKNGFVNKLQSVGFSVSQLDKSFFGETVFLKNGIHPRSVLYIVVKQ